MSCVIAFFVGSFVGSIVGIAAISVMRAGARSDVAEGSYMLPADALGVGEVSSLAPSMEPETKIEGPVLAGDGGPTIGGEPAHPR